MLWLFFSLVSLAFKNNQQSHNIFFEALEWEK